MSYVRINESILGPFATQTDADKLFLMLVRSELDHPVDDVERTTQPEGMDFRVNERSKLAATLNGSGWVE